MFNPRKTEASASASHSAEAAKPASSAAYNAPAQSFSTYDRATPANHSIVDERLTMKGDLESDGDILVKGKVIGNIRCGLLIIDVDAVVEGGIEAEEVVVRGQAKGKIQAAKVRLERTAHVDSEICHQSFSAEEGARIKGALRYVEELPVSSRSIEAAAA